MDVHSLEIEAIFLAMIVSIIFLSSLALHHWRLLGSNQERMIKGTYNKSVFPTYRHCLIPKHIKQQKLDDKLETGLLYSFVHMNTQDSAVMYINSPISSYLDLLLSLLQSNSYKTFTCKWHLQTGFVYVCISPHAARLQFHDWQGRRSKRVKQYI